jgi:hypothetical protein
MIILYLFFALILYSFHNNAKKIIPQRDLSTFVQVVDNAKETKGLYCDHKNNSIDHYKKYGTGVSCF